MAGLDFQYTNYLLKPVVRPERAGNRSSARQMPSLVPPARLLFRKQSSAQANVDGDNDNDRKDNDVGAGLVAPQSQLRLYSPKPILVFGGGNSPLTL